MSDKANILLLGNSGVGKSTLINTVIGKEVARVSDGRHGTEIMEAYESEDLNFRLIDSRGFRDGFWDTQKTIRDIRKWMKAGLKGDKPRIHMLWLCVDATYMHFSAKTLKTVQAVIKEWKDIPIIVVLTKSFFPDEDQRNIAMVEETFRKTFRKTGMPVAIIPVVARQPKGSDLLPRGIEELVRMTEEHLDEAVRDSEEAVYRYDLKLKRMNAHAATVLATSSAAVVGAVPLSLPDSVVLTTLETGLISGIAKIYNLDQKDDRMQKIMSRIIEAGAVSMTAKMALNRLKMIPGVANIAADVLNAVVAGSIVFAIGESTGTIMEKVYLGEIDKENLDWVNKIVNGKIGNVVGKVTKMVANNNGNINVKEIIESLVKK